MLTAKRCFYAFTVCLKYHLIVTHTSSVDQQLATIFQIRKLFPAKIALILFDSRGEIKVNIRKSIELIRINI